MNSAKAESRWKRRSTRPLSFRETIRMRLRGVAVTSGILRRSKLPSMSKSRLPVEPPDLAQIVLEPGGVGKDARRQRSAATERISARSETKPRAQAARQSWRSASSKKSTDGTARRRWAMAASSSLRMRAIRPRPRCASGASGERDDLGEDRFGLGDATGLEDGEAAHSHGLNVEVGVGQELGRELVRFPERRGADECRQGRDVALLGDRARTE